MISLTVQRDIGQTPIPSVVSGGNNNLGPEKPNVARKHAVLLSGPDSFLIDAINPEADWDDLCNIVWQEVDRPGQQPWLVPTTRRLRKGKFNGTIYRNGESVDGLLRSLGYMTSRPGVVIFAYGDYETGEFRITSLSIKTVHREAGTNNVTAATCDFELTEANDPPSPKPVASAPAPTPPPPEPKKSDPPKTTYTVKRGDSLWAIATKFYSNGSAWGRIAEANGIKDPKRIAIGQVLVIP